ncbi:hypothetical protein KC960_02315 [Candidatus Saccharibacteria bacterium]|nr:hypothetical protein [Candidatus Saccharibacteria bacterium]
MRKFIGASMLTVGLLSTGACGGDSVEQKKPEPVEIELGSCRGQQQATEGLSVDEVSAATYLLNFAVYHSDGLDTAGVYQDQPLIDGADPVLQGDYVRPEGYENSRPEDIMCIQGDETIHWRTDEEATAVLNFTVAALQQYHLANFCASLDPIAQSDQVEVYWTCK